MIVTVHAGAEGTVHQHVRRGVERFLGENRGDVARFAHAVVDAGADLVVGHGPHVLRSMEWYKGRLIALLGQGFAGLQGLRPGRAALDERDPAREPSRRRHLRAGRLVPTILAGAGVPALDPSEAAHGVVRTLSMQDFAGRAVAISRDGVLSR